MANYRDDRQNPGTDKESLHDRRKRFRQLAKQGDEKAKGRAKLLTKKINRGEDRKDETLAQRKKRLEKRLEKGGGSANKLEQRIQSLTARIETTPELKTRHDKKKPRMKRIPAQGDY